MDWWLAPPLKLYSCGTEQLFPGGVAGVLMLSKSSPPSLADTRWVMPDQEIQINFAGSSSSIATAHHELIQRNCDLQKGQNDSILKHATAIEALL
jgi:hypothetical protein